MKRVKTRWEVPSRHKLGFLLYIRLESEEWQKLPGRFVAYRVAWPKMWEPSIFTKVVQQHMFKVCWKILYAICCQFQTLPSGERIFVIYQDLTDLEPKHTGLSLSGPLWASSSLTPAYGPNDSLQHWHDTPPGPYVQCQSLINDWKWIGFSYSTG